MLVTFKTIIFKDFSDSAEKGCGGFFMHIPIVFVPGFIGHLRFPELIRGMNESSVFFPDLLGSGDHRDASPLRMSIEDQSAHLADAIHHFCDDQPIVLCAHSGGAAIAMHYAASHPGAVAAIVSAEGHLASSDGYLSSRLAVMPETAVLRWLANTRADPASLLDGARSRFTSAHLARVVSWLDHQPASTIRAAARALLVYTSRPTYGDEVASVMTRLPTYLISGEATPAGLDVSLRFARLAKGLFTVAGAGHAMVLESPEVVGAHLQNILSMVASLSEPRVAAA